MSMTCQGYGVSERIVHRRPVRLWATYVSSKYRQDVAPGGRHIRARFFLEFQGRRLGADPSLLEPIGEDLAALYRQHEGPRGVEFESRVWLVRAEA